MTEVELTSTAPAAYLSPTHLRAADHGDLRRDLAAALNRFSRENGSNTPDFVLAQYLANCLDAFDLAMQSRSQWYGHMDSISGPLPTGTPAKE